MKTIGIAGHLGHKSLFALYKLMNEYLQMQYGQRLLDVEGLQEKLQGLCQWRIDSVFLRRNVIELAENSLR